MSPGNGAISGARTRAPYSPGEHGYAGAPPRQKRYGTWSAWCPVAEGRSPLERAEKPTRPLFPEIFLEVASVESCLEGPGHADAVVVLGDRPVGLQRRERAARHQVVLVAGVHEPAAQAGEEDLLPLLDQVDDESGLGRGVWAAWPARG